MQGYVSAHSIDNVKLSSEGEDSLQSFNSNPFRRKIFIGGHSK